MKFSEISCEQWEELSPFLDTCLLPVTGMTGMVQPFEATAWLERLRDIMDLIEIPFKGRVVTYPAWHYISDHSAFAEMLNEWCASVKKAGFRYIIVVTANQTLNITGPEIDLSLRPDEDGGLPLQAEVSGAIRALWSGQAT
ncbi:YpiF family protein [Paenibacillus alkaliterrae]|uniref:DUF2487 family protein n=1 Tax=Paenibacillus alkaliterrae TaxID=320909 RepID=UPI001F1B0227|nr:DUF2487 family protein [Paenibacillus alkaliterrae]MCF2937628.1 YpiF family protein [Paenibacillus alkaliterrae]